MSDQGENTKKAQAQRSKALPPPPPEALAEALKIEALSIEWLAGDGSDRCYYRIHSRELSESLVLMQLSGNDAQALKDDGYDWIKIATLLKKHGIFVPRVMATLPDHAALIIEDYGDDMLEGAVFTLAQAEKVADVKDLYLEAAKIACRFLTIPHDAGSTWCRRKFDAERFIWELNFFREHYLEAVLNIKFSTSELRAFNHDAQQISVTLANNSRYFVHRDFHSRNIMVKDGKLAVIDFQDARLGPAPYDLVSLCFDSYVPLEGGFRRQLLESGLDLLGDLCGAEIRQHGLELWRPTLLQRQLKAIGSFGYLTVVKKRGDYLKYVAPALRTLEEQDLADVRWPYLSDDLLTRIRQSLNNR